MLDSQSLHGTAFPAHSFSAGQEFKEFPIKFNIFDLVHVWLMNRNLVDSNLPPANVIVSEINNNNKISYCINERFSHANADFFYVVFLKMISQSLL